MSLSSCLKVHSQVMSAFFFDLCRPVLENANVKCEHLHLLPWDPFLSFSPNADVTCEQFKYPCFHVICCSSLALPVTLDCLDRNPRVNSHISRYTLPLGVVFNKDGAAIYQVIVVVFFAKYRGIDPDVWDLFIMG